MKAAMTRDEYSKALDELIKLDPQDAINYMKFALTHTFYPTTLNVYRGIESNVLRNNLERAKTEKLVNETMDLLLNR